VASQRSFLYYEDWVRGEEEGHIRVQFEKGRKNHLPGRPGLMDLRKASQKSQISYKGDRKEIQTLWKVKIGALNERRMVGERKGKKAEIYDANRSSLRKKGCREGMQKLVFRELIGREKK